MVLFGQRAGKMGCLTNFLTKAFAFCPPPAFGTLIRTGGEHVWEDEERRQLMAAI